MKKTFYVNQSKYNCIIKMIKCLWIIESGRVSVSLYVYIVFIL